jgi:anti-sigma factor RsiW
VHPDAGSWQALLDGELSPLVYDQLERHLAECPACRRRFGELQFAKDDLTTRLDLLDSRPPRRSAEGIRQRARTRQPRRLLAAGILLAFATVAGATIHSGVVPRWLGGAVSVQLPAQRSRPSSSSQAETPSGIVVHPRSGLDVQFQRAQREGVIRIVLADQPTVSIVASSTVPYVVEQGRVAISNQGATANYTITLPRTLSPVLVRVESDTVFHKRGGLLIRPSTSGTAGEYVLPLAGPLSSP